MQIKITSIHAHILPLSKEAMLRIIVRENATDIQYRIDNTVKAILEIEQKFLRHLVDIVWNFVTESEEVPATYIADELIAKARV